MSRRTLSLAPALVLMLLLAAREPLAAQPDRGINVTAAGASGAKVALIIGNGAYHDAPLRNPVNDARDMATALRGVGFEVIHVENADQRKMKEAVRQFGDRLRRGEVGLFYYAGHGIQSGGSNYLVPVGANITREAEVEYETLNLGFVIAQMEDAGNALNIVILDACRNNPFARSFRSSAQGLAQVSAPTGTLIAYATAPGSVASDGTGRNGLYTQELLRFMSMPGLPVEEVFKQVRIAVTGQTNGAQTPWESSSLVGHFSFQPQLASSPAPAQPMGQPAAQPKQAVADRFTAGDTNPAPQGGANAAPVVTVPPAGPAVGGAAAADALRMAVDLCMEALRTKNSARLEQFYAAGSNEERSARASLVRWSRAPSATAESSGSAQAVGPVVDAASATTEFGVRLAWRSAFGGNRSVDVPFRVHLTNQGGQWQMASCRMAQAVRLD
jgi:hypothetical protein